MSCAVDSIRMLSKLFPPKTNPVVCREEELIGIIFIFLPPRQRKCRIFFSVWRRRNLVPELGGEETTRRGQAVSPFCKPKWQNQTQGYLVSPNPDHNRKNERNAKTKQANTHPSLINCTSNQWPWSPPTKYETLRSLPTIQRKNERWETKLVQLCPITFAIALSGSGCDRMTRSCIWSKIVLTRVLPRRSFDIASIQSTAAVAAAKRTWCGSSAKQ